MSTEQPLATRDWHTRAIIRFLEDTTKRSVDPWREYTYHKGQEVEMYQWGRAGRPINRSVWWSSYDIDGALIVESDKTEIVRILDEVAPLENGQELGEPEDEAMRKVEEYNRAIDERNAINLANREKPWLPLHDGE